MATDNKLGTTELLYRHAHSMGLKPSWVTPNGLIAITAYDGKEQYLSYARSPLNSQSGASLAKNKYLTRKVMERHGLPNIPFARVHSYQEALAFLTLHGKIIVKPVGGSGSQDIHIVTEASQLKSFAIHDYILEKYILGKELRYLVLQNEIIGVHRSEYGTSVSASRPLQRISYPASQWSSSLSTTALQINQILGLQFAAVDFLIDKTGHAYILEVNTNPGFKWFHAPSEGPAVDVARLFLEAFVSRPVAPNFKGQKVPTIIGKDMAL